MLETTVLPPLCLTKLWRAFFSLPVFTRVSDLNVWTFSSLARSPTANPRCNYSFSRMIHLKFYLISCCDTGIPQSLLAQNISSQCEEQNVLHLGVSLEFWKQALVTFCVIHNFARIAVAGCLACVGIISDLPLPHKRQQKASVSKHLWPSSHLSAVG